MPDEIKGADAVSASPDADSLFYLLKITGRAEIGNRDADGTVKEFFDPDDIGVMQSTVLLQDFNDQEFIELQGQFNDKWVNGDGDWGGLNGGLLLIPPANGAPEFRATWTVGANDRETELNAANSILIAYDSEVIPGLKFNDPQVFSFFGAKIKNQLSSSHNDFFTATDAISLSAVFQKLIDGVSFVNFPGSNSKFLGNNTSNVIQALNKIYGEDTEKQKEAINSPLNNFFIVKDFVNTQVNRTEAIFGPVFNSENNFWNTYKDLTNTSNLTDGVKQNFISIEQITGTISTGISFTDLSDTPTGFESGKFLVANETGLEWTGISFTGLPDTPTGYDDGKILQSTADGLEWVDMPVGGGGGGGGSSSTPQFSRAQVSSSSRLGHSEADVDLDASQLATDSENWIHTNTTRNTVGILVPEDGLYDISFNIRPVTNTNWKNNVSQLSTNLKVVKADGTDVLIQQTRITKNEGNGTALNNHLYLDNFHLDEGDFVYLMCRAFTKNTTLSWAVDDSFSFLSASKSGGGSSSGGGGSSSTISAVNQIQENIDNIPLIGDGVQIPDAILVKDQNATTTNGTDHLIQLDFAGWTNVHDTNGNITSQIFAYETNNFVSKRWYIQFDSTDGSHDSALQDQHVKKEFNSIQEYISNDRALYFGAGGGSSGGSGGVGDSAEVISSSNFGSKIPDVILLHSNGAPDQPRSYYFFGIDNDPTENAILYRSNANRQVSFVNNSAGDFDATLTDTTHVRYAGDTTLQSIIDNGHAIYLGGGGAGGGGGGGSSTFAGLTDTPSTLAEGSSKYLKVSDDGQTIEYVDLPAGSGGVGSNQFVKDFIATSANGGFTGNIPDAIMVNFKNSQGDDLYGKFELHWIKPNDTQVDIAWELIYRLFVDGNSNDYRISFKLDADGTPVDGGVLTTNNSEDHDRNLRWFIDNGRALYFGGGTSSTFSASNFQENILQNHISTDNDPNFNDLHFTGLEIDAYYRLGGQVRMVAGFDADNINYSFVAYQNSFSPDNIVGSLNNRGTVDNETATFNHIFQATGDLFFTGINLDGSEDRFINGDGTKNNTFLQLEKL